MVRRSTFLSRAALATLLALVSFALTAPLAGATSVRVKVRVEGLSGTVAPTTLVDVPAPATFEDSTTPVPNSATFPKPVAMGALAILADTQVFPFTTSSPMDFLNSIAGRGGPPDWTSWWGFAINGLQSEVGLADPGVKEDGFPYALREGDALAIYEVDSALDYSLPTTQLVVRVRPRRGLLPGQTATISVVGDNLAKVNSTADAKRWRLDPAADVEAPSQFPVVAGTTVHVGRKTYSVTGASVSLDLPLGTYRIWAEKAPDATHNYVRSSSVTVNCNHGAAISNLRLSPSPYRSGRRMAIRFGLDKTAKVSARIVNSKGRTLAKLGGRAMKAGSRAFFWTPKTTALTSRLTVRVRAVDNWSRATTRSRTVRVVR